MSVEFPNERPAAAETRQQDAGDSPRQTGQAGGVEGNAQNDDAAAAPHPRTTPDEQARQGADAEFQEFLELLSEINGEEMKTDRLYQYMAETATMQQLFATTPTSQKVFADFKKGLIEILKERSTQAESLSDKYVYHRNRLRRILKHYRGNL